MNQSSSIFKKLLRFYSRGEEKPPLENSDEIDRLYRRCRLSVIVTLTLGYGFAYTCRLGLSVIKKPLIDLGIFSPEQLGWIGAAYLWGYGAGKVFNGFLADRVNVRIFIPTGLAISALFNLAMGNNTFVYVAIALWGANGWFQGFGAPSSVVSITQWFSGRRRGTMYGIWSGAHSLGEGLTYFGTAALVSVTTWNAAFIGPGFTCLVVAVALYFGLRDRPQTMGLPPVNEWAGQEPEASESESTPGSATSAQLAVLKMPAIWIIGLSSALMYVTRYAINNWGVLYLQEAHGFSLTAAGGLIGVNTISGIGGCVAYGYISDRFFAARRPPLTLMFGIVEILSLLLIFYCPKGDVTLLTIGFVFYGFTLSGLLAVLGGLFAVDLAPKRAAGAAMGIIGVFSYIGAGIQELVSGSLIGQSITIVDGVRQYDFSLPIMFWLGASVLSMILAASQWRVKVKD
ncbi:MAG: MFS transporter [Deltaproteobacteria bacterium]|nr:MFS transporter [Deltaproteobacteria bacterium]